MIASHLHQPAIAPPHPQQRSHSIIPRNDRHITQQTNIATSSHQATSAISLITAYSRLEITFDYFKSVQVLPFDQNAHTSFESLIRQRLRVGTQDLRSAAIALSVNGIVVTRNQKDCGKVPNLQVENWAA